MIRGCSNHFRFHFHIILLFSFLFFGNYFYFRLALKVDKISKMILGNQKLPFPFSSLRRQMLALVAIEIRCITTLYEIEKNC